MGDCSLTCAFPWVAVRGTSTFGGGIAGYVPAVRGYNDALVGTKEK
jgi:hypothetical protein